MSKPLYIILIYFFAVVNSVYSKGFIRNNDKNSVLKNTDLYVIGGIALLSVVAIQCIKRYDIKIPKNNIGLLGVPLFSSLGLFGLLNKKELTSYKYIIPAVLEATSLGLCVIAKNNMDGLVAENYYELVLAQLSLYSFLTPLLSSNSLDDKKSTQSEPEADKEENKLKSSFNKKEETIKKQEQEPKTGFGFSSEETFKVNETEQNKSIFPFDQEAINREEEQEQYDKLQNDFSSILQILIDKKIDKNSNLYNIALFVEDLSNNKNRKVDNELVEKINQINVDFSEEGSLSNSALKNDEMLCIVLQKKFSELNVSYLNKDPSFKPILKLFNQCLMEVSRISLLSQLKTLSSKPCDQTETNPFSDVYLCRTKTEA